MTMSFSNDAILQAAATIAAGRLTSGEWSKDDPGGVGLLLTDTLAQVGMAAETYAHDMNELEARRLADAMSKPGR